MTEIPRPIRFSKKDKLDYSDFHSKQTNKIISNQDFNTARELVGIKNAADEISAAQIKAATVVAEAIEESTSLIEIGQERIINSLEDLKATFDWKLSDMIWLLEQQRDYFKEIIHLLERPRLTKANELRDSALKYYKNGWIDEAINDFTEAKKLNPTDFIIYQSLGNIYLFQKKDIEMALECYKKAAKYAIDYPYYISYAFLHVGLTNYVLEDYREAYNATKEAIESYPNFSEAHYQHAQYCSKLGKYDEALSNLRMAIDADRGYCAKALSEADFIPMSGKLKNFFEDLTNETKKKADIEIGKAQNLVEKFEYFTDISSEAKEKLEEGVNLRKTGNYLNYRDSIYKAKVAEKIVIDLIPRLSNRKLKLEKQFNELKESFDQINPKLNHYKLWIKVSAPFFPVSVFGVMAFLDGFNSPRYEWVNYPRYYNNIILDSIPYVIIICAFLSPIIIPLFLYNLYKYIGLLSQKISRNELDSLNKQIDENRQFLEMVESEKTKLNIDEFAKTFDINDYEKYLRKTYG